MNHELLTHLFIYDRDAGTLAWRNPPKQHPFLKGKILSKIDATGCITVGIKGKLYKVHRLIWFIENNTWPKMIDHINGDRKDNRIINLRGVESRTNQQNQHRHRAGKLVGASFHKIAGRWRATIKIEGKAKHLGHFDTEFAAHQRYLQELKERGL